MKNLMAAALAFAASAAFANTATHVTASAHGVVRMADVPANAPMLLRSIVQNEHEVPHHLPLSDDDRAHAAVEQAPIAPLMKVVTPTATPSVAGSFLALGDDGRRIPPDVHGAASPTQLVVSLNSQIAVQDRLGGQQKIASLESFFASVAKDIFDPRVLYDKTAGRWVMTAGAGYTKDRTGFVVAVSRTSDANGTWDMWRFDGDATHTLWMDHPNTGITASWIVIAANMYLGDKYDSGQLYLIDKSALYSGDASRVTVLTNLRDAGSLMPVTALDNTSTAYVIQTWNGNSQGKGYVRLYIATTGGLNPLSPASYFSSNQPWGSSSPTDNDFAPQSGSSMLIDAGDDRIDSAIVRNGSIWFSHTVYLPADQATHTAAQWWQLSLSPAAVVQRGVIDDPTGAKFYAYPSIAVNKNGDVLVGGSQFSPTAFPSAFFAFRAATDTASTMNSMNMAKAGEASYYKTAASGSTANRWGDYTATVVDPTNDTDFWTIQEYATVPFNGRDRWSTWWTHVVPSSAPAGCGSASLCLASSRFDVSLQARDQRTGNTGTGQPLPRNDLFGYFSLPALTGNASNPEVFVKILDARTLNGKFWVFYGGLTDLEFTLTVTDRTTGLQQRYQKSGGSYCGNADTSAFSAVGVHLDSANDVMGEHAQSASVAVNPNVLALCTPSELCLNNHRFAVGLFARDQRSGRTASGQPLPENDLFGYFSLPALTGDPQNPEVFVKILDGRPLNGQFWVFYGGLTDVELTITILDTTTGVTKTYSKPAGSFCGGADINAF